MSSTLFSSSFSHSTVTVIVFLPLLSVNAALFTSGINPLVAPSISVEAVILSLLAKVDGVILAVSAIASTSTATSVSVKSSSIKSISVQ